MKMHLLPTKINNIESWFQNTPPKEGCRQWKDGRSAK